MLSRIIALLIYAVTFSTAQAQLTNPSYEAVSQCFFVYSPIAELGRALPHAQLFQFGQSRIAWVGGYIQANQNNTSFRQVFEINLERNKRMAIQLESSLKRAIQSRNQSQFLIAINRAIDCDRMLGIRATALPAM